jgi:hypothetical protein
MYRYRPLFVLLGILLPFLANAKENGTGEAVSRQKQATFFLENKGQFIDQFHNPRNDIDFRLKAGAVNVFVGKGELHYQWIKNNAAIPKMSEQARQSDNEVTNSTAETYRLDVTLVDANKNAEIITEDWKDYRENYYLPQCPGGITAHAFGKIIYKNVYPGIDWVLYVANSKETEGFKYDFIVHEGANIDDIKLRYDGDTSLQLVNGRLIANTPLGGIMEEAPYAFEAASKKSVNCNYILENKTIGFNAGDHKGMLIIDPTVDWARYYGTWYSDNVFAMATRFGTNAANMLTYIAGETNNFDLFITTGVTHAGLLNDGNTDAFYAGFDKNGKCIFSTLYGGTSSEGFRAIACDTAGNIYAAGGTSSSAGIAYNGHQNTIGGEQSVFPGISADGFFVKFDGNGTPVWASYYGGESWDIINSVSLDSRGNLYISGGTYSTAGISTTNGFQKNNVNASEDGFLAKFNSNGIRQWATYYGGTGLDDATSVICDNNDNIYMAGNTLSFDTCNLMTNAIATTGSFKPFHSYTYYSFCQPLASNAPGLDEDGFVVKFDSSGNRLWGTYYGGKGDDYINSLSYDSTKFIDSSGTEIQGVLYLGGVTESTTGIATSGGFQQSYSGTGDGMLAAFKPDGSRYWGSYFGGTNRDIINGIFTNQKGSLFVTGFTASTGLATPDAYKRNTTGATDAFLAVFNGAVRQTCTYYGGSNVDYGVCVTIGNYDKLYFAGNTRSWDSISNNGNGAYNIQQPSYGGNITTSVNDPDAFIVQLSYDQPVSLNFVMPPPTVNNTRICIDDSAVYDLRLVNALSSQVFQPGNVFTMQLSDTNGSFAHPANIATYISASSAVSITAKFAPVIIQSNNYKLRVISSKPVLISNEYSITLMDYPKPIIASTNSPLCVGDTLLLRVKDSLNTGIIYHWNGPDTFSSPFKDTIIPGVTLANSGDYRIFTFNGYCRNSDTFNVVVNAIPGIQTITNNSPICVGDSLKLAISDTIPGLNFNWTGPIGFTSNLQNPVIENIPMTGAGKYIVHYSYLGCNNQDSTNVVLLPAPARPFAGSNSPVCDGDTVKLFADDIVTGVKYMWSGPGGYYTQEQTPLIAAGMDVAGTYFVRSKLYDCVSTADSVKVIIKPLPPVPLVTSNSPLKEGNDLSLQASIIADANYTWTGPNGFNSSERSPLIKKVTKAATGSYTVLTTVDGCSSSGLTIVVINEAAQEYFVLYPNPNKGIFTIKITLDRDQVVPLEVVNEAGQEIYRENLTSDKKLVYHTVILPESLANGVYFLKIRMDGNNRVIPFTVNK